MWFSFTVGVGEKVNVEREGHVGDMSTNPTTCTSSLKLQVNSQSSQNTFSKQRPFFHLFPHATKQLLSFNLSCSTTFPYQTTPNRSFNKMGTTRKVCPPVSSHQQKTKLTTLQTVKKRSNSAADSLSKSKKKVTPPPPI